MEVRTPSSSVGPAASEDPCRTSTPVGEQEPEVAALRSASAIFRALSPAGLRAVCDALQCCEFVDGEVLPTRDAFILLREGTARREVQDTSAVGSSSSAIFGPGNCIGEAALLGVAEVSAISACAVWATSHCSAWLLHRDAFLAALAAAAPADHEVVCRLAAEACPAAAEGTSAATRMRRWLQASRVFGAAGDGFLALLAQHLEDVFLGPGEPLPALGADGGPALFLVLGGRLHVEGANAALLRVAKAGEVIGEATALGVRGAQEVTALAAPRSLAYCMRLPAAVLLAALHVYADEGQQLEEAAAALEQRRAAAAQARYVWIAEHGAPALAKTPLLAGCPAAFLQAVAGQGAESSYPVDAAITVAGDASQSLHVILDGSVFLESRTGVQVGRLTVGGTFGEVEILGLFGTSLVTARAATPCRILSISQDGLQRALAVEQGSEMRAGFARLVASRHEQVARGMPLCGLRVGAKAEDVTVKAVALQAERLPFEAGELWRPIPDADPGGPRLGVLAAGRAVVELVADGTEVLPLGPGSLVCEGLLAEFGARVRAVSSECEAYRVRLFDLIASSRFGAQAPDWFYQFRLLEQDASKRLRARLSSARGLIDNRAPHPCDPCIREWTERRQLSVRRAEEMRRAKAEELVCGKGSVPQLPLLPPAQFGTTAYRSWGKVAIQPVAPLLKVRNREYPRGLGSYAVVRLPKIKSEPALRAKEAQDAQKNAAPENTRSGLSSRSSR